MADFDELAHLFERFAEDTRGLFQPWLEEHLHEGGRAVDLGCGYGRFTGLLAARYEEVLAIDVAAREIEMARARNTLPNVVYRQQALADLVPERDGRFDLVLAVNTLHHAGDHREVLPHVRSLVAPGGHALLVDIVDTAPAGARATREWHESHAFQDAHDSYTNPRRSRSPDAAADILRLRLHPAWLAMVTRSPRLTRREYHQAYGAVFPGARFDDDIHTVACAMRWIRPVAPGPAGPAHDTADGISRT
ncbi:class I SAM-dependent methyltransferase [Streptomyces sp. WMMC500]|uniref:class I SAM-dependent methyltransferase n=1 Tax=Streptomyces sp. WMMC500 TaxID=3015154 RepID=UPI00248ACD82|nr:class I SAM-dependent methyltransferase [Streptomyces sp. WMMC500]WBB58816.1 class I SAM-dependent methyltransferase [Streptomyces sp. WMMC500]